MNLTAVRIIFIALTSVLALALTHHTLITPSTPSQDAYSTYLLSLISGLLAGIGFVGLEIILSQRMASLLPSIVVGIVLGILTGSLTDNFLTFFDWYRQSALSEIGFIFFSWLFIYMWSFFIIQTRDTFKVSIPYVDFKKQGQGIRPFILDTTVLIDGRFVDLSQTHLFESPIIVPGFVLLELQHLADGTEKSERNKGLRGLEKLKELRSLREVRLDESMTGSNQSRDQKLIHLVQKHDGILISTDTNLCQVASLQDIDTINFHEMATRLKPVFLPGDQMTVKLIKPGETPPQGVGYTEDGSMVVVDQGQEKIGSEVHVVVTSSLQTNAGKMIFARLYE